MKQLKEAEMGSKPVVFVRENNIRLLGCFLFIFLSCMTARINLCSNVLSDDNDDDIPYYFLKTLELDGSFSFADLHRVAKDFGNRFKFYPSAILSPKSVSDISTTINHIYRMGSSSELTVAARGNGHSLHGQAQARRGVIIEMESLRRYNKIQVVRTGNVAYVDVYGGELWINVLQETLKYGLSPKSWTDYLYLTVGGTLSNAGISGQAFQHGPQISNVYQLEVVTGKGEVLNCSKEVNSDLFHGVLGGLGQFGIITRARIALQPAPKMVRWIRVLYSDFSMFANDQEHLISSNNTFDYIEGFVLINRTGLLNNWRSSFSPQDPDQVDRFNSDGRTLYCLEMAKYFNLDSINVMNQEVESLLSQLSFIPSILFYAEVSYLNFLDRVHSSETKLKSKGFWEVPHPWLNLLIPRSRIHDFVEEVFGKILTQTSNGPVLIYPLDKSKWSNRTSAVTPEENIFYLVAFLSSAMPSSTGTDSLEHILNQNERILDFCQKNKIGMKQYLADYATKEEWRTHFGSQWETFVQRKIAYDPLAILAPGQKIFRKGITVS